MKSLKWVTGEIDSEAFENLQRELKLEPLVAKFLAARGITSTSAACEYLKKDLSGLNNAMLLKDMDRAVERIRKAISAHEKIVIYGDYDADGITATYIMLDFLRGCGADCGFYIPDRAEEGYGVSIDALKKIQADGASLVITVDAGVTAIAEAEYANSVGLDIIISDHHECPEILPDVCAVVNPHRSDCTYPFCDLAGVGVAFKLICAILGDLITPDIYKKYLPMVCIGTVADLMPLTGENRIIVGAGLKELEHIENIGLSALFRASGADERELTAGAIGFLIAPRINAAGRMGSANDAVELLLCKDTDRAKTLADELCSQNEARKKQESVIMEQALAQIEKDFDLNRDHVIIAAGDGWHQGVLGIVASRICGMFNKPVILISFDGDTGKGSGRSVEGLNLYSVLSGCAELLEKFGGHELAAGLTVARQNISRLRQRINELAAKEMEAYIPTLSIDFEADDKELTVNALQSLSVLEPFGAANPKPVLRLNDCRVERITPIGNNRHLKLVLKQNNTMQCVFFGKTLSDLPFSEGDYIDVAFTPELNDFRGLNVQLHIKDARPRERDYLKICEALALKASLYGGEAIACGQDEVNYDKLAAVWRFAKKNAEVLKTGVSFASCILTIEHAYKIKLTPFGICIALDIFKELKLLDYSIENLKLIVSINAGAPKTDLKQSALFAKFGTV